MALRATEIARVKMVILPININIINVDFPIIESEGVIPILKPTVPIAEKTSNVIFIKSNCGSLIDKINIPAKIKANVNKTTV